MLSSISWVDGALAILVVIVAVLGGFRGLIAQLASAVALLAGAGCGIVVKQWLRAHWLGAQPGAVFWALSWLVALLAAFAAVSLIHTLGDRLGRAIENSPLAALDRFLGVGAGAILGIMVSSLLVLAAVRLPMSSAVDRSLGESWSSRPLLSAGASLCRRGLRFPAVRELRREFLLARHQLGRGSTSI